MLRLHRLRSAFYPFGLAVLVYCSPVNSGNQSNMTMSHNQARVSCALLEPRDSEFRLMLEAARNIVPDNVEVGTLNVVGAYHRVLLWLVSRSDVIVPIVHHHLKC